VTAVGRSCGHGGNGSGTTQVVAGSVHRFPHPVPVSEGPDTLAQRHVFPVFPRPYYYWEIEKDHQKP
jgi:hypothetical protein